MIWLCVHIHIETLLFSSLVVLLFLLLFGGFLLLIFAVLGPLGRPSGSIIVFACSFVACCLTGSFSGKIVERPAWWLNTSRSGRPQVAFDTGLKAKAGT